MPISFVLPNALQAFSRGSGRTLVVDGQCATVADAFAVLGAQWPGVVDRVMTEQGEVRPHVNIFVGQENIRFADGLRTPVSDGDEILIVAAVSGG